MFRIWKTLEHVSYDNLQFSGVPRVTRSKPPEGLGIIDVPRKII
jgi:hypothetical protein